MQSLANFFRSLRLSLLARRIKAVRPALAGRSNESVVNCFIWDEARRVRDSHDSSELTPLYRAALNWSSPQGGAYWLNLWHQQRILIDELRQQAEEAQDLAELAGPCLQLATQAVDKLTDLEAAKQSATQASTLRSDTRARRN